MFVILIIINVHILEEVASRGNFVLKHSAEVIEHLGNDWPTSGQLYAENDVST